MTTYEIDLSCPGGNEVFEADLLNEAKNLGITAQDC
jgi:hypothetical protein